MTSSQKVKIIAVIYNNQDSMLLSNFTMLFVFFFFVFFFNFSAFDFPNILLLPILLIRTHAAASPLTLGLLVSMYIYQLPEAALFGPVWELGVGSFVLVQSNWSSVRSTIPHVPNSKSHVQGSRTENKG